MQQLLKKKVETDEIMQQADTAINTQKENNDELTKF